MADEDFLQALPPQFYSRKDRGPDLSEELLQFSDSQTIIMLKKQVLQLIMTVQRKPRPSYNIDGQEVKWTEYLEMLYGKLSRLNELLADDEGPIEEAIVAWT